MKHTKIKTNKDYCCIYKIRYNMLVHYLLDHGMQRFFEKRKSENEIEHKSNDVKLTFKAKCCHKWTRAYSHCKCKAPNFQETQYHNQIFLISQMTKLNVNSLNLLNFFDSPSNKIRYNKKQKTPKHNQKRKEKKRNNPKTYLVPIANTRS